MSVYGALDMVGNVKVWTADGYEPEVGYEGLPDVNPIGIESENGPVVRGGSYQNPPLAAGGYILRKSYRGPGAISWTLLSPEYGIRCAADQPVAAKR